MKKFKFLDKKIVASLPETPGVYAFKSGRTMFYIGKAASIKQRVKSHFHQLGFRDALFISKVKKISYIKTNSEIEALLLEAKLIKKYQPKFNVLWRDDKNYFYVGVTKEDFPRIFITHQPKILEPKPYPPAATSPEEVKYSNLKTTLVGPFVDGKALKLALKTLRKVFHYRSCKTLPKRPCLWHELHCCPGPCLLKPKEIPLLHSRNILAEKVREMRRVCQKDASNLVKVLQGRRVRVLKSLEEEMRVFSKAQEFEKAAKLRDQITALESIIQHTHVFQELPTKENQDWLRTEKKLRKILEPKNLSTERKNGVFLRARRGFFQEIKRIKRIEGYDVSNIRGQEAAGAMAVFENGEPNKKEYRKFKIKITGKPNDIAMLKEVLSRRFQHLEWKFPELILVDGGKAQLNIALDVLNQRKSGYPHTKLCRGKTSINVFALAKRKNELYLENRRRPLGLEKLPKEISNLILHLRDEAHRFAIAYHRELRKKALTKNN